MLICIAGNNEQNSNKSGTIEMYAPSSYNETMTGETLSSVSEKSETYSDSRQDYVSDSTVIRRDPNVALCLYFFL